MTPWACFTLQSMTQYSVEKYSRCRLPTAKACLELGHATGQQSGAKQQIYNRMSEKQKKQSAAMFQAKRRPQPD